MVAEVEASVAVEEVVAIVAAGEAVAATKTIKAVARTIARGATNKPQGLGVPNTLICRLAHGPDARCTIAGVEELFSVQIPSVVHGKMSSLQSLINETVTNSVKTSI